MKLVAYNIKTGVGVFCCPACDHLHQAKRRILRKCPECQHSDPVKQLFRYKWLDKPVGYSRLFPPEEIKQALRSLQRAQTQGVKFTKRRTFAGLRVVVVSIPPHRPNKNKNLY